MKVTIFTPTYNRERTLPRLYMSLKQQTSKNFIWLIVDDGSTDNTNLMIKEWIKEGIINIKYHFQENQGKSAAHNVGVGLTETELFTCVDSDDFIDQKAVEKILHLWKEKAASNLTGILAFKGFSTVHKTTIQKEDVQTSTLYNAYMKHGLKGDTMLIFRTEVISRFKFPKFNNEKFVPEAYLYDLIDQEGQLILLREVLYYSEYLIDGYTKNMTKVLKQNPQGYLAFIKQRIGLDTSLIQRIKDTIRYSAMCISARENNYIGKSPYPIITRLTLPIAFLFYIVRYRRSS